MRDIALLDRLDEMGLRDAVAAIAASLAGVPGSWNTPMCVCDARGEGAQPRGFRSVSPHDRACPIGRFIAAFAGDATTEHCVNQAHEFALEAVAIASSPRGRMYDDVERARAIVGDLQNQHAL